MEQLVTLIEKLRNLATEWTAANDRSLSRLATMVANDGKLFDRIEAGGNCTVATLERFFAFFAVSANWPNDTVPAKVQELLSQHALADNLDRDAPETGKAPGFSAQAAA